VSRFVLRSGGPFGSASFPRLYGTNQSAAAIFIRLVLVPLDPAPLSTTSMLHLDGGYKRRINPYLYLPVDRKLETLRDSSITRILTAGITPTIYPPAAQMLLFFAVTRITQSVIGFKGTILLVGSAPSSSFY